MSTSPPTSQLQLVCPNCHQSDFPSNFIELSACRHRFCILCTAFIYFKYRGDVNGQRIVRCGLCHTPSTLTSDELAKIEAVINTQVVPFCRKGTANRAVTTANTVPLKSNTAERHLSRQTDNDLQQTVHQCNRFYYSRNESPRQSQDQYSRDRMQRNRHYSCPNHLTQELSLVCFSCNMSLLCVHCAQSKRHTGHYIESLNKAAKIICDQINQRSLQAKEEIQNIEMAQRRLHDRGVIIKDRAMRVSKDIRDSFSAIINRLNSKADEMLVACQRHFSELLLQLDSIKLRYSTSISALDTYRNTLEILPTKGLPAHDFIRSYCKLSRMPEVYKVNLHHGQFFSDLSSPVSTINQQLELVGERVDSIQAKFRQSSLQQTAIKAKSPPRQTDGQLSIARSHPNHASQDDNSNDDSDQRDYHQSIKRTRTNMVSPASSRDKKVKKHTKTEEDQRKHRIKYRTEAASRGTEAASRGTEMASRGTEPPRTYITKFLDKVHSRPVGIIQSETFNNSHAFGRQAHNSTSKGLGNLAKSINPNSTADFTATSHNRKTKDRLQRKTVQTNQQQQQQSIKVKKNDNRRKK